MQARSGEECRPGYKCANTETNNLLGSNEWIGQKGPTAGFSSPWNKTEKAQP